ncbi:MAG: hypothetical protein ACREGH_02430 [Minisyncoccia bacterium]
MSDDQARFIARWVILLAGTFLVYWVFHAYVDPYIGGLFTALATLLQHYLELYTSYPYAGWYAAWIVIAIGIGMLNFGFVTEFGAGVILLLTLGAFTRGPVTAVTQDGRVVSVWDSSIRRTGQALAFVIAGAITLIIVLHLLALGAGAAVPAVIVGHAAGYTVKHWHRPGWKPWAVFGGFVVFTVIARDYTTTQIGGWLSYQLLGKDGKLLFLVIALCVIVAVAAGLKRGK